MPTFTAFIDRDFNRKVTVHALTASHAREYATSRFGKVTKLKIGAPIGGLELTTRLLNALSLVHEGVGIRRSDRRKLRALGLLNEVGKATEAGLEALNVVPAAPATAASKGAK